MKRVVLQTVHLAGVSHLDDHAKDLVRLLAVGEHLKLTRVPSNPHDQWAIAVSAVDAPGPTHVPNRPKRHGDQRKYTEIGWIPKVNARLLAKLMDGGQDLYARVDVLNELGQAVWMDIVWRRDLTEREKAGRVVTHAKHAKRTRLDL